MGKLHYPDRSVDEIEAEEAAQERERLALAEPRETLKSLADEWTKRAQGYLSGSDQSVDLLRGLLAESEQFLWGGPDFANACEVRAGC